jgi:hypothetical protein
MRRLASRDVRLGILAALSAWISVIAAGLGLAYLADIGLRAAARHFWGIG